VVLLVEHLVLPVLLLGQFDREEALPCRLRFRRPWHVR
jgi:hypothetical protein